LKGVFLFIIFDQTIAMKSEILSDKEIRKYSQQIQLPGVGLAGQEKIKKARVLVIGAGGKGASVLQSLAASGIGFIGICDNYLVEEEALPRQSLYGETDLGKQKAIISRQRLSMLSRLTDFELHNICLSESNILNIIRNYDIILDATDNFTAHYLISDAVVAAGKPMVFSTVFHHSILVSVFNHAGGPSLRDLYPQVPHDSGKTSDEGIGSSFVPYNLAGNFMAHETLKLILGFDNVLSGKVLQFLLKDYSCTITTVTPPSKRRK
jgi:molybdopterin/thiamine biosynthesis adenylyltransferase